MKAIGYCCEFEKQPQLSSTRAYVVHMFMDVLGHPRPTGSWNAKAAAPTVQPTPPLVTAIACSSNSSSSSMSTSRASASAPGGLHTAPVAGLDCSPHRRPRLAVLVQLALSVAVQLLLLDVILTTLKYLRLPADAAAGLVDQGTAAQGWLQHIQLRGALFGTAAAAAAAPPGLGLPGTWERVLHCWLFAAALYLHFGFSSQLLRLALALLAPAAYNVFPPMFRQPWLASGATDLWSYRWHQMFRSDFTRLALQPSRRALAAAAVALGVPTRAERRASAAMSLASSGASAAAEGWRLKQPWRQRVLTRVFSFAERGVPVLAVFALSGIIHEYMVFGALGARFADGRQLTFFLAHGVVVLLEGAADAAMPRWRAAVPLAVHRLALAAVLVCTCELFMGPWLDAGFHRRFGHPLQLLAHCQSQLLAGSRLQG